MLDGVRLVVSPETTALALGFVLGGILLGTVSGLTPGLHVNNLALLLAAAAPAVPGPPAMVGAAMIAAGVMHTFLEIVPTLAIGVPDPAMAPTALPGHRMVLGGRGREALRLSALGSGLAIAFAAPLAVPVTVGMQEVYPHVRRHLTLVLGALVAFLVLTESSWRTRTGGVAAFVGSTALGATFLDSSPAGLLPTGDVLAPLFAGLFGVPVLLDAAGGDGVPEQADATVAHSRRTVGAVAGLGTLSGAAVGYLPGVSSAIAAAVVLFLVPRNLGARGFVVATSGVNTANAVFALFALFTFGTPRTGVLVAVERASVPLNLPLLLGSVCLAAAAGFVAVPTLGDRYLRTVGRLDPTRLSVAVLGLLAVISVLFAGVTGLLALVAATLVGLVPPRFGARRVHLMGVLIGPLML